MKDPLTKDELDKFLYTFSHRFGENYEKALSSGAVSEEDVTKHDHTLARCILMITAKQFKPLSKEGKKLLANLNLFI